MDTGDLSQRRRQMGEALAGWSKVAGAVHEVGGGSWLYLSNLPSPDLNMALVHGSDPRDLGDVLDRIEQTGAPALLFCTGDGLALAENVGAGWPHVGAMPFMIADTMARAGSQGVEVGLLGATPAGKPLYDATGWSTLEDWEIYTNGSSAQFH